MEASLETRQPLLERERERARLGSLLDDALHGDGHIAVVEGPAGVGKTAMLALARQAAAERGLSVLSAECSELEQAFPFGAVRQLFEPWVRSRPARERERLFAGAAALAEPLLSGGFGPEPDRDGDAALPLLHGLYWLLANLSMERPVLVTIDDLHWSDRASVRFVEFLLRRLAELPALVVAATRPTEPDHQLRALLDQPRVETLRPEALSERAVAVRLREDLGEPDAEFTTACHAATGGNPLFVAELVRALREAGIEPVRERASDVGSLGPDGVARSVVARLRSLPPGASELARAIAVLDADAELRLASELAGVDTESAAVLADSLVKAALVRGARPLRFLHPIMRSAVYAQLNAVERGAAHRRAARLLETEGATPERVAVHLVASEPSGDVRSVDVLSRAAEAARARGAPEVAAHYLRRALAEPPPRERRAPLLSALGEAELAAGHRADAESHLREALRLSLSPRERGALALALAQAVAEDGRFAEGAAMLAEESSEVGREDRELALELEAELAGFAWLDPAAARPSPDRFERYAGLEGSTRAERKLLATAARVWTISGRPAATAVPLARRALERRSIRDLGISLWTEATFVLLVAEEVASLRELVSAAASTASRQGAPFEFFWTMQSLAALDAWEGDLQGAEANVRLALDVEREHGWSAGGAIAEQRLLNVLIERGRLDEADRMLAREGLDQDLPDTFFFNGVRAHRARLRIAQGRVEDAIADLRQVGRLEEAMGIHAATISPWRSELAVALGVENPTEARDLARDELELARKWGAPGMIGIARRALGLVEGGDRGIALLGEAVEALAGSARRLEHARALVDLGAALRRTGRRRDARGPLREGADLAHRCGADALSKRAIEELRATGARPRKVVLTGVEALTPMERRIAAMAAEGLRNVDIAQTLFVTVKNVEMHLSRAYGKLGISSRKDLPEALGAN